MFLHFTDTRNVRPCPTSQLEISGERIPYFRYYRFFPKKKKPKQFTRFYFRNVNRAIAVIRAKKLMTNVFVRNVYMHLG